MILIFDGLPVEEIELCFVDYVWDLISNNGKELLADYQFLINQNNINSKNNLKGKIFDGVHLVEKENIFVNEGAVVKPGAVLDAAEGPIYIDENAQIFSNAVVEGPVYVGKNSQIKICAIVYDNVSIGRNCKVGGEVEDSIILPFSNKQHAGFIGHAYIGSWINIGADTNCSDLKNNYGYVKPYLNGKMVDSKMQFLGVIMGDHSKTAINTMFNTGTTVGFSSNIFGAGFPEKYIPSFSWGGVPGAKKITYDVEKSIEVAKKMMARRNKQMGNAEEKLFQKIFDLTNSERIERGYTN